MELLKEIQTPLIEELNVILENNIMLLCKLSQMHEDLSKSPLRDLQVFREKLQRKISTIKTSLALNDQRINHIQVKLSLSCNLLKN